VALYFMYYNYARVHQTLRFIPAMAAGIAVQRRSTYDQCGNVERAGY